MISAQVSPLQIGYCAAFLVQRLGFTSWVGRQGLFKASRSPVHDRPCGSAYHIPPHKPLSRESLSPFQGIGYSAWVIDGTFSTPSDGLSPY